MSSALQATIIALLISLLVGFLIGYSLRQGRISDLSRSLKQSQKRHEELEREHELRLQEATLQLQRDYETQLAEKIEHYQDQIEDHRALLEQEYQGRLAVVQQGHQGAEAGSTPLPEAAFTPDMSTGISPDIQYVEQQIKRQYETRLKEAAHKIQQAYEQHLRQKLRENRDLMQKDYENRLAQKIEHYEQQLATQIEQLQSDYEFRLQALRPTLGAVPGVPPTPGTPSAPGWDTTIAMAPLQPPPPMPAPPLWGADVPGDSSAALQDLEAQLRQEYEQKLAEKIEHYQDDLAQRVQGLEAEYEARLQVQQTQAPVESAAGGAADVTADVTAIESQLRQEYEQKLAEKIEHYQDDLAQRVQGLESEYETRLQVAQQAESPLQELQPPSASSEDLVLEASIVNIEVTELSYSEGVAPLDADELDAFVADLPDPESLNFDNSEPEAEPSGSSSVSSEAPFSLDDILAPEVPSGQGESSLPLDSSFDANDFNLDELLFEETSETDSNDLPPDLDDISRLS